MPLLKPLTQVRYSERGPVPRPLNMGEGMVVMLLCLQDHQELIAPENDLTETIFTVRRAPVSEGISALSPGGLPMRALAISDR